jgi:hypothetical protein
MNSRSSSTIAPWKAAREAAPGYRLGRSAAGQMRGERLAGFRAHQRLCSQCLCAADVAEEKRMLAHQQLCVHGYPVFRRFAFVNVRLARGYYPDRGCPKAQSGRRCSGAFH